MSSDPASAAYKEVIEAHADVYRSCIQYFTVA
jgi:hypothetical protein